VRRVLPAHIAAAAAAIGLALANAVRIGPASTLLLASVVAGALALAGTSAGAGLPAGAAAGAVVLVLALGWGSVRLDALDRSVLEGKIDRAGRLVVVVTGEPRRGTFQQRVPARTQAFERERVDEPVQLELPLGRAPPQGSIVSLLGVLRAPRGPERGFDERLWLRRQGVHVVVKVDEWHVVGHRRGLGGLGDRLRAWLRRASAPGLAGDRRAVLEGIVLGDDAGLTDRLKTSFRRSGLYHLLAVSGQNVVLIAAGALGLAWLIGLPRWAGHLGAVASILGYVLAVGPQPSVIRAAVAGIAVSAAWLTSRERDPWHALLLAAVVLLAWNPYALFDAGFELSFAAVVAIFVALGPVLTVLEGYPIPRKPAAAIAVSATCSLATAPILWLRFGQVPLLGVVANALVEPVVGLLLGLGLITAVTGLLSPAVASLLAAANGWVAAYVAACARAVASLPLAQANGRAAAVAGLGSLVVAAYAWRRWLTTFRRRT
jgi:competence protein ComEC